MREVSSGSETGQHAGPTMHWYAEGVFPTVKEDHRGADTKARVTQPRRRGPDGPGSDRERCQANAKTLHHRINADKGQGNDYEHQERPSYHLLFNEITQGCELVLALCEFAH